MFRKPKNRSVRQRVRQDSDEREEGSAPKPREVSVEKPIVLEERSPSPELKVNNGGASNTTTGLLSFDDDEGADTVEFKLKKQDARKRREKLARRARELEPKGAAAKEEKSEILIQKTDYDNVRFTNLEIQDKPVFKPPVEQEAEEEEVMEYEDEQDRNTREKFPTTFQDIPDAQAVYEARKKREEMRRGMHQNSNNVNDDGYIPLNGEKERNRKARDSGSDEDDDDHGRFYSSKEERLEEEKRRRELHMEFLSREQGDADDQNDSNSEDEEILRWEREQIKKGVSRQQVIETRQEWLATSTKDIRDMDNVEQDVMEIDAPVTRMPARIIEPAEFIPVPIEQIISDLRLTVKEQQEILNCNNEDIAKIRSNLQENAEIIANLPSEQQRTEERYRMLQEMKEFSGDLIECFDEKVPMINDLEDKLLSMWKERKERLVQRRRLDVKDEYEACSSAAAGNTTSVRSAEQATRAAERDARRSRRRLQREKMHVSPFHHSEGFSSDDEETNSQLVQYKETSDTVTRQASDVFIDVVDDYIDICRICDKFVKWIAVDEDSYTNAYIGLCVPKLLNPLIRYELIDWNPLLSSEKSLPQMNWYKRLLAVGTEGLGVDLEHEEIVKIIPSVVQKCILPRLIRLVNECYDPLSLQQSRNLGALLSKCIDDYPTLSASSKEVKLLLKAIHEAFRKTLDEDLFIPIFGRDAIENTNTGCAAFLNRQFWAAVKAIHCIKCITGIFSDESLQALVLDGVVNRSINLALQCIWPYSTESENVHKCRAVMKLLPKEWLPAKNPAAFRSLCSLFSAMAREYSESNRSFSCELKKFVKEVGH
ncbi:hypothetical protein QR680_014151 [Steinernema hermaphroditum]|uniref:GCF C-terminal domain-containing protein n=1 Tax=Steinernema hermaphroditum TaxID=289476 RepID=A0AA39M3J8_9BILA|nr:hypothetical protein QR680_014151 [Steinernema hermaphroditum]